MKLKLIIVAILLAGLVLVGTVGATIQNITVNLSYPGTWEYGNITSSTFNGNGIEVTFTNQFDTMGNISAQFICNDNWIVWSNTANQTLGSASLITLSNTGLQSVDGCYVVLVSTGGSP